MSKRFGGGEDAITITITENGEIIMEAAGTISAKNHQSADDFLAETASLAGGEVSREKLKKTHTHTHTDAQERVRS